MDARRAHLLAQAGELTQLVRGVYVDSADDVETTGTRPRRPDRALSLSGGVLVIGDRGPSRTDAGRAIVHQRTP